MNFIKIIVFFALGTLAFSQAGIAHPSSVTTANSTGVMPYNVYGGSRENHSLATGNLNLQIPLLSLPGRAGNSVNLSLIYDSKIWQASSSFDPLVGYPVYSWNREATAGWRLGVPYISSTIGCEDQDGWHIIYDGNFVVTMPDGSKHSFQNRDNSKASWQGDGCNSWLDEWPSANQPITDSTDASFAQLDTSPSDHAILRLKNGTKVYFYGTSFLGGYGLSSIKVVDTNGNRTTYNYNAGRISSITDTIGRAITFAYPSTATTQILYKDSNGNTQTVTLNYAQHCYQPTFTSPPSGGGSCQYDWILSSVTMPLPNNRVSYTFQHNNFGELTKIIYPAGGYTRYEYGAFQAWLQLSIGSLTGDFRQVTAKNVCSKSAGNCTTGEEARTTYTPTIGPSYSNNSQLTVRDPNNNRTVHVFNYVEYAGDLQFGAPAVASPREQSSSLYAGENTLLRSITSTYFGWGDQQLPASETTTLHDVTPNLVSKVERDYGTIDNVVEEREYDYGLVLKRKKKYTYLGVHPSNGVNYPTSLFIKDRRTSEEIHDGNAVLFAKTEYEYDTYTEGIAASGAVERESSFGTGYVTRGNLTAVTRHKWQTGVPGIAYLTTRGQFDDSGNTRKSTNPRGHNTIISYSDYWNNTTCAPGGGNAAAYPKTVTNHLGHVVTNRYNSCSGTLASTTDVNNQVTSFSYDALARVLTTTLPTTSAGTGFVTVSYNEANLPMTISSTRAITTALSRFEEDVVDGLGRVTQSKLCENFTCADVVMVDRTYDLLGRPRTVSNPHRAAAGTADGITTTDYDALGRITRITNPDNTFKYFEYAGTYTVAYDETERWRMQVHDALGRLTFVQEPKALASETANYSTYYRYDVLSNLRCVQQLGNQPGATPVENCDANLEQPNFGGPWRVRKFSYDSLSQLLTAKNPESGQINYTYDANGNVATKTDARGLVTTYSYDSLNRLAQKTYSDGTILAGYDYDSLPGWTLTNAVGRLTRMRTADHTNASIFSYDAMGRVILQYSNRPSIYDIAWFQTTATYNLDGSMASLTYPSGRKIDYTYDAAGRPLSAKNLAAAVNFVENATYHPSGAEYQRWSPRLYSRTILNNRLQPDTIYADDRVSATLQSLRYYYNGSSANNGNVYSIHNLKDSQRSLWFGYDQLNRLTSATTELAFNDCSLVPGTSLTKNWGNAFSYDPWGNLLSKTVTKCSAESLSVAVDSNNRIIGKTYDAAGNMTNDGLHTYNYDAESRISNVDSGATTYAYDADGMRVRKTTGSNFTEYLFFGGNTIVEKDQGNALTEYIYFGGKRVARRDSSGVVHYFLGDHLGTSRLVTSTTGVIEEDSDFYPFGGERAYTDTLSNQKYKFTGKERDAESGLDYFGARYYGNVMGRFATPDEPFIDQYEMDPQSWNLYSYVRNNPLNNIDPNGQECTTVDDNGVMKCNVSEKLPAEKAPVVDPCESLCQSMFHSASARETWNNSAGAGRFLFRGLLSFGTLFNPVAFFSIECLAGGPACTATDAALTLFPFLKAAKVIRPMRGVHAAEILQLSGGKVQAAKDFDTIQAVTETLVSGNLGNVRVKVLSDGTKAVLRPSKTGPPTIEIQYTNGTKTEVRY